MGHPPVGDPQGVLPGNTFAINEHGLSITTDALSPRHINPDGLGLYSSVLSCPSRQCLAMTMVPPGRYFVNRDALTATSIGDLIARIATATSADGGGPGRASGFCCNAVSYREGRAVNIEFAPSGHSVLELHVCSGRREWVKKLATFGPIEHLSKPNRRGRVQ